MAARRIPMRPFLLFFICIALSFHLVPTSAFEFDVNWVVPNATNVKMYNEWAAKQRFQVGDTITFKYDTDSVMVVDEDDYEDCNSEKPIFYSNSGNSLVTLDRSGLFYFISGVAGHCKKGQKMIVKVLGQVSPPGSSPPPPTNNSSSPSGAASMHAGTFFSAVVLQISAVVGLLVCYSM